MCVCMYVCMYVCIYIYIYIHTHTAANVLTHYGIVMPYGDIDLGQHWLWSWLDAWWHQAITYYLNQCWLIIKVVVGFHLGAKPQEVFKIFIHKITLKITPPKLQQNPGAMELTHWGWVMHICINKLNIIGSDNGLLPGGRKDIIWTNAGIFLIGPLGAKFNEILIKIHTVSFKKMYLKMSSGKCWPFCLDLNVLSGEYDMLVAIWCHVITSDCCGGRPRLANWVAVGVGKNHLPIITQQMVKAIGKSHLLHTRKIFHKRTPETLWLSL